MWTWHNLWKKKQDKNLLGIEIGTNSFCATLVRVGTVTHVLGAFEEKLPEEAMSNFILLISLIVEKVHKQNWQFEGVAVADSRCQEFLLPLRSITDTEMQEVILHEMETGWGLVDQKYVFDWYRKDENNPEVVVGVLSELLMQNYFCLANELKTNLLVVTGVKPIQFGDKLVYDGGYPEGEQEHIEKNFCGAVYATLVAAKIKKDFNLCLHNGNSQNVESGEKYRLASKIVALVLAVILGGLGIFYVVSEYKLSQAKKQLVPWQSWDERFVYCTKLNQDIINYKNLQQRLMKKYCFKTEQMEQILDALPDFNAEILAIRTLQMNENKQVTYYVEVDGKMQKMSELQHFVNELKSLKAFDKVNLQNSKNLQSGELGYTLRLRYAK